MLRLAANEGWWLVTHPDHAHLAGEFAAHWGNQRFARPEPRDHVLRGIHAHDDGWKLRDAETPITRDGKPAAFSSELVGKYSAFEEIDLEAYLAVRRRAVELMAAEDAYAAILISMHTHNLLSERADRRTIRAEQLPLLDEFLAEQMDLQRRLQEQLKQECTLAAERVEPRTFMDNFRLLQAVDNLSLLSCVDFSGPATLLHPLRRVDGGAEEIAVTRIGQRHFRLTPYPFRESSLTLKLRARFVPGTVFGSAQELRELYEAAKVEELAVSLAP